MNDQFLCYSIMFVAIDLAHSGLQKKNFLIGIVKFSRSNEGAALTIRKDKRWRKWSDITRYVTGSLVGNTSCQRSCRMNRWVVTHCVLVVPQGHSATAFIRPKPGWWAFHVCSYRLMIWWMTSSSAHMVASSVYIIWSEGNVLDTR